MAIPPQAPTENPFLRDYLAAKKAYEDARQALIVSLAAVVQTWCAKGFTEAQMQEGFHRYQVPEALQAEIFGVAVHRT